MNKIWTIGVDTGGTFTDGLAISPEGVKTRWKVLSNGCLRGKIIEKLTHNQYRIQQTWGADQQLFQGYQLRGLELPAGLVVRTCDPLSNVLTLNRSLDLECPLDFEISAGEEAPVLICRLATGTRLGDQFPPMALRLGTTRGTNALLEGKGAHTALLVTKGFKDLLVIGTQQRPNVFALAIPARPNLANQILEIDERISSSGEVIKSLKDEEIFYSNLAGIESVAVSLLNSHRNPGHERRIETSLAKHGHQFISTAHTIAPFTGYLAKTETTLINAYLSPVIDRYLDGIRPHLTGNEFLMMNSAGNLEDEELFQPKNSFLSGPAGGCMASMSWAISNRSGQVITFDMGGTSTDTARFDGQFAVNKQFKIYGLEVIAPCLDIHTVAAGGGSIISFHSGQIHVGPESAGAHPGPAAYGLRGPLTITDVNILLGKIYPASFKIPIHREAAINIFGQFHKQLEGSHETHPLSPHELLLGIEQIANEKMADAIKKISVGRGFDPSVHTMLVYGGAGGLHACKIAELLGITKIAIPYDAGIWSAKGMAVSSKSLWVMREIMSPWETCKSSLEAVIAELATEAAAKLNLNTSLELQQIRILARLLGQDTSLDILWPGVDQFVNAFLAEYRLIYGYMPPETRLEIERIQILAGSQEDETPQPEDEAIPYLPPKIASTSPAFADGIDYPVYRWESLKAGALIYGPAVVANDYGTTFIEKGWQFLLQADQTLNGQYFEGSTIHQTLQTIVGTTLFMNRFTAIAEEMGAQLERSATSVNIKERKDFSCAILDREGFLLVNAPHIPVHLGSLGICCRLSTKAIKLEKDDVLITNHPAYGGSHLPDLTLIAPVYDDEDVLLGYVANRAHHAEIGGKAPGSMPVDARTLVEEGVIIRPAFLVRDGQPQWQEMETRFKQAPYPTRNWSENKADLAAALASVQRGKQELIKLARQYGANTLLNQMQGIKKLAASALEPLFELWAGQAFTATEYLDDGYKIKLSIQVDRQGMTLDFNQSSEVHPLNLNANLAIVYSAILYCLRIWVDKPIPLNEGLLENVQIILPQGFLNPKFSDDDSQNPAVVGGNTEVSQRLVDTLFKALGLAACSQGTMNNFLFGDDAFGYYETIGGGVGATALSPGRSGCHQHMTNTKITDPEVIELRYPVRLEEFSIRNGSGGKGIHPGGHGLIRRMRFLKPLKLTFLSQHRVEKPYGMAGGEPGAPGEQWLETSTGIIKKLPGITQLEVGLDDIFHIATPGGGAWGNKL